MKAIERDLRDLTPDVLQNKIKNLTEKVRSYPKERPDDTPLPSDFEEAQRIASEAESLVSGCQSEFQTCEDAAKKAEVGLNEARLKEAGLAARIEIAGTSKEGKRQAVSPPPELFNRMRPSRLLLWLPKFCWPALSRPCKESRHN